MASWPPKTRGVAREESAKESKQIVSFILAVSATKDVYVDRFEDRMTRRGCVGSHLAHAIHVLAGDIGLRLSRSFIGDDVETRDECSRCEKSGNAQVTYWESMAHEDGVRVVCISLQ